MITKNKKKKTSRILEAVHETARDLQAAGLISKRRMKDYDALREEDGHGRAQKVERGRRWLTRASSRR